MKQLFSVYSLVLCCTAGIILSCNKNNDLPGPDVVDYSNINLKDKPIATIQKATAGKWKQVMDSVYGWAGWTVIYPQQDRFVYFFNNDSVKIENSGYTTLLDKGNYIWGRSVHTPDSVYTFTIPGKLYWVMDKIYNDTLRIDAWPDMMYLKRMN